VQLVCTRNEHIPRSACKRVACPTHFTVRTGRFKTLIFPYRKGAALPKTTWNAGRTTLTVTLKGQTDVFTFTPAPDGRTRIALTRNNAPVLTVK